MTDVTVTLAVGTTAHYWLFPKANETTLGLTVPEIIYGWATSNPDGTPTTVSLTLDSDFVYDVRIDCLNAPPIIFEAFEPSDGVLMDLLITQGWVSL